MAEQTYVEQKYIDYWRKKQAEQDAQCKIWEREAWQVAKEVASRLQRQFGATEVIVFGSLAKGQFGEDSDIDLAVAGLKTADFFPALSAANANSITLASTIGCHRLFNKSNV